MPRRWNRIGADHGRAGAGRVKAHLLAFEVLERVDVRPHQQVDVADVHAGDEVDALVDVGDLLDRPEVLEHIGIGEGDVDALEIEQVLDVVGGAVGDHGNDAQLVPVIEIARDFRAEADEGAFGQAAGEADGPVVDLCNRLAFSDRGGGWSARRSSILCDLESLRALVRRGLGFSRADPDRNAHRRNRRRNPARKRAHGFHLHKTRFGQCGSGRLVGIPSVGRC